MYVLGIYVSYIARLQVTIWNTNSTIIQLLMFFF